MIGRDSFEVEPGLVVARLRMAHGAWPFTCALGSLNTGPQGCPAGSSLTELSCQALFQAFSGNPTHL